MKKSLLDEWIVDMDGAACRMRKGSAEPLEELSAVKGDKWLLSDFGGAMSRFLVVDAPAQFAEIVAQRRLQETGDAQEHARILTHWKRARGKRSTELFFTVVEGERFRAYEDQAHDDPDHHLLFSIHALMFACLRAHSKNRTVAVLFEHDRHVDLLLGRSGQVLAASRVSSYANTKDAKENQAETVAQELRGLLRDHPGRLEQILHFGWLQGSDDPSSAPDPMATEWAHALADNLQAPLLVLPAQTFATREQRFVVSSIPAVLEHLTVGDSSSPVQDRLQYQAKRLLSRTALAAVALVVLMLLSAGWWGMQAGRLNDQAKHLADPALMAALQVTPLDPAFQKSITFADNLSRLQRAPTLQTLFNDLSAAIQGRIRVDQVLVEYDDRSKIQMTLKGRFQDPFPKASQDHEAFVANLKAHHFRVIKSDLSTDVNELQFTLKLERE
ncbi:MAG: hypothetical protein HQL95_07510 [Magnetococcales bacterium]|nr:hypothetical protein [Magnetococcales bacterium]